MAMDAFDLAERLQTIVYVMSDLDLGMNTWMSRAVRVSGQADRSRQGARRGEGPRAGRRLGPIQGRGRRRHPLAVAPGHRRAWRSSRAAPGHNEMAQYTERPDDYVRNLDRLARKFDTATHARAAAGGRTSTIPRRGSASSGSGRATGRSQESRDQLREESGLRTAYLRLRAYPFTPEVRRVHPPARSRVRRRAEPRRADAESAADRRRGASCAAPPQRPALQRAADRRAEHHGRDPAAGTERQLTAG